VSLISGYALSSHKAVAAMLGAGGVPAHNTDVRLLSGRSSHMSSDLIEAAAGFATSEYPSVVRIGAWASSSPAESHDDVAARRQASCVQSGRLGKYISRAS